VLICRCAWHRRYRGYPLLSGVASWRGWTVRFTDGICETCLERFRSEHRTFLETRRVDERRDPSRLARAPLTFTSRAG
jgi:hypothetical protein